MSIASYFGGKDTAHSKKTKDRDELLDFANKEVFGNSSFRPHQREIISAVLEREDVFVVMPTGGGKSLCYQLPAVLIQGLTVVVSPLLSLIEDQVSSLVSLPSGGVPAAYLTSSTSPATAEAIFRDLARSERGLEPFLKLLYVTPERLVQHVETQRTLTRLYNNEMLARFVIDEAHCVSSWGHDFRKDYAKLGCVRDQYPDVPLTALTATARKAVADDVMKILQLRHDTCRTVHTGHDRPNLFFEVRPKCLSKGDGFAQIAAYILGIGEKRGADRRGETGVVYCMTKRDTELLAMYLQQRQIRADFYHAGQSRSDRQSIQAAWLSGDVKVLCATIAYGMGIDKPDVRYVLHLSIAKSMEGYYQEAGRAGRDGAPSECILFYNPADIKALVRIMKAPPKNRLSKRDESRLEEMQEYCTEWRICRRQSFAAVFGCSITKKQKAHASSSSSAPKHKRCDDMCDNCWAHVRAGRRRCEAQRSVEDVVRAAHAVCSFEAEVTAIGDFDDVNADYCEELLEEIDNDDGYDSYNDGAENSRLHAASSIITTANTCVTTHSRKRPATAQFSGNENRSLHGIDGSFRSKKLIAVKSNSDLRARFMPASSLYNS